MVKNDSEVPETERILSRSSRPSKNKLGGEGIGVGLFLEDGEEAVSTFGDEDDVRDAIIISSQIKAQDCTPTTSIVLPLSVSDKCLSQLLLVRIRIKNKLMPGK